MSEHDLLFVTTLNRELCAAIGGTVDDATGDEVYSAFVDVVPAPLTLDALSSLSNSDFHRISDSFNAFFECSGIGEAQIRSAVEATLRHWDPSDGA